MKVVIDSSILIDYLRGGDRLQDLLIEFPKDIEIFLPTIVLFEIFSGQSTRKHQTSEEIKTLIEQFTIIDLNSSIATKAGELYRDGPGNQVDSEDYIIAASALELAAKVVTLNQKHFKKIPGLDLYPL